MAKGAKIASEDEDAKRERYNRVVESAELSGIQLVEVSFNVEPRYYGVQDEVKLGYDVKPEDSYYDPSESFAACIVKFHVDGKDSEGTALKCDAKYTVAYRVAESCEEEAVKLFLRRVGVFACYPYFRGLFANLDWAANTRLPPLPVHKEPRVMKKNAVKKVSKPAANRLKQT
jgi:hypothetical protein